MTPSPRQKHLIPTLFFLLCALEGGLALILHLRQPSEAQNAVWLGFSKVDLAIAAGILVGMLAFTAAGLLAAGRTRSERLVAWLEGRVANSPTALALLVGLSAASLLLIGWNEVLATLLFGLNQLRPLLGWAALVSAAGVPGAAPAVPGGLG